MPDPIAIYSVWLNEQEKDQIIAIWEKNGILSSVVEKIRAAEQAKGIR